jgi:hypothetical protein
MRIRTGRNLQITSFLFIMLFLMSCGGRSGEMSDEMWWYERIESWQIRELSCLNYPEYKYSTPDFIIDPSALKNVSREVSHNFKYFTDRGIDYWQTSCETIQNGKGDCEDLAILLWNKLRMIGYPDEKIGMLLSEKDGLFHVCVVAYYSEDDFYIIDPTGYFTWDTVPASEFLANEEIKLILWFNLFLIQEF